MKTDTGGRLPCCLKSGMGETPSVAGVPGSALFTDTPNEAGQLLMECPAAAPDLSAIDVPQGPTKREDSGP